MYRKILAANDGSEAAFKALSLGLNIAASCRSELHMIIVEEVPRFPASVAEVKREIELLDQRYRPVIAKSKRLAAKRGVELKCHVIPGRKVATIAKFARDRAFDLVIAGFRGHSVLHDIFTGSTAGRLARLVPCSILIAK
jgi:nucleotide-binding universal stress UspA family protein